VYGAVSGDTTAGVELEQWLNHGLLTNCYSSTHKRSKSGALSLLRRKDKEPRSDNDAVSEDGSHTSSPASRPKTSTSPPPASSSYQTPSRTANMSLGRVPSREPGTSGSALTPSRSNIASAERTTSLEQSVRKFRIFEALRSGNTVAISKAIRETSENGPRTSTSSFSTAGGPTPLEDTTVLHLAIQCAQDNVVEYVLSNGGGLVDVNARDKDGNTPLHIAASQGRANIVKLLMEQKDINDAISNNQGKLPLDVARTPEIFQQLQLARTLFVQDKVQEVQDLVRRGNYERLGQILEEPRVQVILDINSVELPSEPNTVQTGGTLLHEAARKRDTKLIQALLLHGADPFQRDRKGKLPQHVTNDDVTRAMLKKSPAAVAAQRGIQEKAVLGHATSQAGPVATSGDPLTGREPTMKGYLKKWTNYRKGYQLRWFVLENGVLSYYKHQDDAENACRGAISMRIARLHMSPEEKTKFEIIGKSSVKYTLKANHEVEAKRWFWALNNAIQWMKDQVKQDERQKAQSAEMLRQARDNLGKPSDASISDMHSEAASTNEPHSSASHSRLPSTTKQTSRSGISRASTAESVDDEFVDPVNAEPKGQNRGGPAIPTDVDEEDDDDDYLDTSSRAEAPSATKDAFIITAQSARLQLDTLAQVSAALQAEANRSPNMSLADPKALQALAAYDSAVKSLKGLMGDLLRISKDRDAHWQYRLEQEVEMRRMWEDSMAKVAAEQEILEARVGEAEKKRKLAKRALREVIEESRPISRSSLQTSQEALVDAPGELLTDGQKSPTLSRKATALSKLLDVSDDSDTDEEEFFDAVDAGEVDVEPMPPSEVVPSDDSKQIVVSGVDVSSAFKGYENGVRTRLKLDEDNRPKVGLWVSFFAGRLSFQPVMF